MLPSSNINGGHFTSTNSSLLYEQDNRNVSAGSHKNYQQTYSEDEQSLKVQRQSEELLEFLLLKASPTKEQIQSEIQREIKRDIEDIEEIKEQIKEIKEEINKIKAGMEAAVKDVCNKMLMQLNRWEHR